MEKGQYCRFSNFWNSPTVLVLSYFGIKNLYYLYYRLYKHTQTLNWDFSRHLQQFSPSLKPVFATIEKFQWFSGVPSPLNGMVRGNHWYQWFFDGFEVRQPLVSMVYDGFPPLVQRWNGCLPSLKSSCNHAAVCWKCYTFYNKLVHSHFV